MVYRLSCQQKKNIFLINHLLITGTSGTLAPATEILSFIIRIMTQKILFLIAILIGAAYARKYGMKAKSSIQKFQLDQAKEEYNKKIDYLEQHVFYGLKNQNDGFDAESVNYFLEEDFKMVLDRVEKLNIGITGIEPWLHGEFYDVLVAGDYGTNAFDSNWYKSAFEKFRTENKNLLYAAGYIIPSELS